MTSSLLAGREELLDRRRRRGGRPECGGMIVAEVVFTEVRGVSIVERLGRELLRCMVCWFLLDY